MKDTARAERNIRSKVADYFGALNDRDADMASRDFHPESHTVKNAANPAATGPTAMADTIAGLFERTESVKFTVRSMAEIGNIVMADWTAVFTFADGAVLNGQRTRKFRTPVEGIDVFTFDSDGYIVDCQIVHETASVARGIAANRMLDATRPMVDAVGLVSRYLAAEEDEDLASLTGMFAENVVVRNAANPPDALPGSLQRYLESFWQRTSHRKFVLHAAGIDDDDDILAYFSSVITFRAGAPFGPVMAAEEFTVELPTALRFHFDGAGKICEVSVFHETTTAMLMATRGSS